MTNSTMALSPFQPHLRVYGCLTKRTEPYVKYSPKDFPQASLRHMLTLLKSGGTLLMVLSSKRIRTYSSIEDGPVLTRQIPIE